MNETEQAKPLSPVDQVLAMEQGKSLLDTRPAGAPVPKWLWVLPLSLGLPGAIIAWLIIRRSNPEAGIVMLVLGVVMTIVTIVTTPMIGDLAGAVMMYR